MFQFTRPRGARRKATRRPRRPPMFQFTRPRGARLIAVKPRATDGRFQFTRPRGARRWCPVMVFVGTWSFNSRAHEGRDATRSRPRRSARSFNSRAHEGRDAHACPSWRTSHFVSIHAPTRGATCPKRSFVSAMSCFNSRAHEGRDPSVHPSIRPSILFQFTRPRGARRATRGARRTGACFNSRAHEGRDLWRCLV